MSDGGHHHAHGPANRGRFVLTTAAPLFVCEPPATPAIGSDAVVSLHGRHGLTAGFERAVRAIATRGLLVAAPILYYRDGGREYLTAEAATIAYASLTDSGIDDDIDAAIEHIGMRLGLRVAGLIGPGAFASALLRAGERHPAVAAMCLPEGPEPGLDPGSEPDLVRAWIAAVEHLGCVGSAAVSWQS